MTFDHNERHCLRRRKTRVAAALAAAFLAAAVTFPGGSAQAADAAENIDQFTLTPQRVTGNTDAASGRTVCSSGRARTKGWIELHRPDGEVVHIKADQIVFVMSATGTGAAKQAHSKLQLLSGFSDVRESVEEVMQAIQNDVRWLGQNSSVCAENY
jgi:hypothetical protein